MTSEPTPPLRDLEDFAGIASDWFWETDSEHRFTYFSKRMEDVTHMRIKDIIGRRRDQLPFLGDEQHVWEQHLEDLRNHRPFRNLEYKIKRQLSDGFLWLRVSGNPVLGPDGSFKGYRGTGHDITPEVEALQEAKRANAALAARNRELDSLRRDLELAAFEDPLTGLRNRRAFDAEIAEALAPYPPRVGLLHIDLDKFKEVNDRFGHPAGDMVLVTIADRINALCDPSSEVFRTGGDEFLVIMKGCSDMARAVTLGEAVVDVASTPVQFGQDILQVGASVGVALTNHVPTNARKLIVRADNALYAAKQSGRSCVRKAAA